MRTPLLSDRTYNYVPIVWIIAVPTYPNHTFHTNVQYLHENTKYDCTFLNVPNVISIIPTFTDIRCSHKYVFEGTKLPLRNVRTSLISSDEWMQIFLKSEQKRFGFLNKLVNKTKGIVFYR